MEKNTPENQFFDELLSDTAIMFKKSPVYEKQQELGKNWNYAVCATPIIKGKGIIFGINWGGDDIQPQTTMPTGENIVNYTFIKQSRKYLEQLGLNFSDINFNYTNLCFLRTPKANLLEEDDFRLSIPLFEKYVRFINPPWLLSIGGKNMKILDKFGHLKGDEIVRYYDDQRKFRGHSAPLWEWNVFSVPHPQARLSKASNARQTIWEKIIFKMNNL